MEEVEVRSDVLEKNGDLQAEENGKKKEDEETSLDGEFIKVEKEPVDVKDDHGTDRPSVVADTGHSHSHDEDSSTVTTTGHLSEAQERIKELECVLERVSGALEASKSENYRLGNEVLHTKDTIEKNLKKYEEMEIIHSKLKDEIVEAEERNAAQLNSLHGTLQTHEAELKEFTGIKEAFDSTTIELEKAKNKVHELEQDLSNSVSEARMFEEMHRKRVSDSESQIQQILELESLLNGANTSSQTLKDHIYSLQTELHEKVSENHKVSEEYSNTSVALSTVQEEFQVTRSLLQEAEQQIAVNKTLLSELSKELSIREASESRLEEEMAGLKLLLASSKEDLLAKLSELEETKFILQDATEARGLAEENFIFKETQLSLIRDEFDKAVTEKEELKVVVSELDNSLLHVKGLCSDLESKLTLAEENLSQKELLLSQTLSNKEEEKEAFETEVVGLTNNLFQVKDLCSDLETKLKLTEDTFLEKETLLSQTLSALRKEKDVLDAEMVDMTCTISQKSDALYGLSEELKLSEERYSETDALRSQALLDKTELENTLALLEKTQKESETAAVEKILQLEEKFGDLNLAVAETKSQLQDADAQLAEAQRENKELREELGLTEVQNKEKGTEILVLSEKLSGALGLVDETMEDLNSRIGDYEHKLSQLELNAAKLSSRNLELGVELEELMHSTRSKQEYSSKREEEMQLLIEEEKERVQKLEEQLQIQGLKFRETEADSVKLEEKVSQLTTNIEAFEEKTACLDKALKISFSSEKDLKESLDVANSEKVMLEEALNVSDGKLTELERLLELSHTELSTSREKLVGVEDDLRATGVREGEAVGKLKIEIEQSAQKEKIIEESILKIRELELLVSDFELKLQEAGLSLSGKEVELRLLNEKLKEIEDRAEILVTQNSKAEAALVKELGEISLKVGFLEKTNEEITHQLSETEIGASQFASDNEILMETNSQLKVKIEEIQGMLDITVSDKVGALKELDSHINTISELTNRNNRISDLLSVSEDRVKKAETDLETLNERFNQRDGEAREMGENLRMLRSKLQAHEEHAKDDDQKVETWRLELENTTIRLKDLEHFVKEVQSAAEESEKHRILLSENNLKLTQEVSFWELKFKDIAAKSDLVITEKHQIDERLRASENEVENLTKQLASEIEKLQSQVTSLLEENNSIKKEYGDSKNEVQALTYQFEKEIRGQKAIVDTLNTKIMNLEAQIVEKSSEIISMKDLEAELILEKDRMKLEVENISVVVTSKEAELSSRIEDHSRKERDRETQFELVGKLQAELDRTHISQKKEEERNKKQVTVLEEHVKELENKLQSTNSRKKGGEGSGTDTKRVKVKKTKSGEGDGSGGGDAPTSLKFVIGVAFVSAIMGLILGKQY